MLKVREFRPEDAPVLWTLSTLPNIGNTADPDLPLALPAATAPPEAFGDLADVSAAFFAVGGAFLVAEHAGHLVGMGGFRRDEGGRAEVLRVRVHPATRRLGVGRALMARIEEHARGLGYREAVLDTATNMPEAMAFYQALGYREAGRRTRPEWSWTLVYYLKVLAGGGVSDACVL